MAHWLQYLAVLALFALGLRLSAFFSGSETGFYRLSLPRLGIDARAGDRAAAWLLWISHKPAFFVATCLIGNNVANYICTAAIAWGVVLLVGHTSESLEIVATLAVAPVIFEFGELLPKSVYYMAPLSRLKKELPWFRLFFRAFLPLSWPLVRLTQLFERAKGATTTGAPVLLGRSRLVQLMQHGHQEGVLSDVQSRLANGLLQLAPQRVTASMIPGARVLGVPDSAGRQEMLDFARRFGLAAVAVHRAGDETAWYGYAFVAELLTTPAETPVIHQLPTLPYQWSKLEALYRLHLADAAYGAVVRDNLVLGIVARKGLIEQIYRPELVSGARASA